MRILGMAFATLVVMGAFSGKLFVVLVGLGMIALLYYADKVFKKQEEASCLQYECECSTMTALAQKETEASQSFN